MLVEFLLNINTFVEPIANLSIVALGYAILNHTLRLQRLETVANIRPYRELTLDESKAFHYKKVNTWLIVFCCFLMLCLISLFIVRLS